MHCREYASFVCLLSVIFVVSTLIKFNLHRLKLLQKYMKDLNIVFCLYVNYLKFVCLCC